MGREETDSVDVTDLTAYRRSREQHPELLERLDDLERKIDRLSEDRVTPLEREMDALADDLADFRRQLDETNDRAWTAVQRATICRNEVDRVIDRVNHLVARLNN